MTSILFRLLLDLLGQLRGCSQFGQFLGLLSHEEFLFVVLLLKDFELELHLVQLRLEFLIAALRRLGSFWRVIGFLREALLQEGDRSL